MTAIHWSKAKEQIRQLVAQTRFGLFSDLDGTLAPIAPTPEAAAITPGNRQHLQDLAAELPLVALISGRRAASLQAKVGLPGLVYVGNHGLEQWLDGKVVGLPQAAAHRPALEQAHAAIQAILPSGAVAEDKGLTLSIHYRQTKDPREFMLTRAVEIHNIARQHGLVLFTGKMVLEVRPPVEVDKGTAFSELALENKLTAALFLGDDVSDLSALETAARLRTQGVAAYGVGVQSEEAPPEILQQADYVADGVADVEELLGFVLMARKASST
ncbi:MAG: trehalose-phosphatase [Anaerolineales bacterium]|nr:MAG: trehalose-phosphatase [Anaerolineales bacterium]